MKPRAVTMYELALDLAGGDEQKARDYLQPINSAKTLQHKLERALEVMGATSAGGIVGSEVQTSTTDPQHVRWVDWYQTARQTIDELLAEAP